MYAQNNYFYKLSSVSVSHCQWCFQLEYLYFLISVTAPYYKNFMDENFMEW